VAAGSLPSVRSEQADPSCSGGRRHGQSRIRRGYVIDTKRDQIAPAQRAVDGEIEERQVPHTPLQLQSATYGPDVADPQWWLWAPKLCP